MGDRIISGWRALPRALQWLIAGGILCHFAFSFFYATAHYFIPDEMVYLMMNESLAKGRLALDSGYEEYVTPMFIFGLSVMHEGKVHAQYPAIYSFLSLPFYLIGGKAGLMFINELCFVLIGWLTFRIQKLLFASDFSAGLAVVLALLGGYLWVYAQAIAPHLLQLTLIMGAAWLMLRAFLEQSAGPSRDYLLAGVLYGLALGVRYDTLFALPLLMLPLLFVKPIRWRAVLLLMPGITLALVALAYLNFLKFGTLSPISYAATDPNGHIAIKPIYYIMGAFGLALLAGAWILAQREQRGTLMPLRRLLLWAVGGFVLLLFFATPWVFKFLYGFLLTVVDYSSLPMDTPIKESALRTPYGGFMYLGEYKRALLQSAPFIALLALLPLARKLKLTRRDGLGLLWLSLMPMAFIFFYGMLAWDGGFSYHMRYYTPLLPFLAMMAAQLFSRLREGYDLHRQMSHWLSPMLVGAVVSLLVVLYADSAAMPAREWLFLKLPLALWLAVVLVVVLAFYDGAGRFIRQLSIMVCAFAMFWGTSSTLLVFFPHLNEFKQKLLEMSESYEPYLSKQSVVVSVPRYFTGSIGRQDRKLYIATIFSDGEVVTKENMRGMIEHFLRKGYSVYITHDMLSLPLIRLELEAWGMREINVREADAATQTPALSQFVFKEPEAP